MKKFTARVAEGKDSTNYAQWLNDAAAINLVDRDVYKYPTCMTLVVEADGEPMLMDSLHCVAMLEALAPKPGIAPKDEARALRELYDAVRRVALFTGQMEVWFACADERLHKFIEKKGFKKVLVPMFKMKIGGKDDPLNKVRPEGYQDTTTESQSEASNG